MFLNFWLTSSNRVTAQKFTRMAWKDIMEMLLGILHKKMHTEDQVLEREREQKQLLQRY
jgi:hypothetical protein